jgi:hypothetical protein
MNHRVVTRCRCCTGTRLDPVVDLGVVPLANAFQKTRDADEARFPLVLLRCHECGLLTLSVVVDPQVMFSDYPYVSGTSPTMVEHFGAYARDVAARFKGFVVEIGSNDGTLLRQLPEGVKRLGVEPAKNVAELARQGGVPTMTAFFNAATAAQIVKEHGKAKAIIGNNVIAHIDDLDDLATAVTAVLDDDGAFVFEVPHAMTMQARVEFDTVYHEHLSYFSLRALTAWLKRHDFEVFDVGQSAVHGGSIRVHAARVGKQKLLPSVEEVVAAEAAAGLDSGSGWKQFAQKIAAIRTGLPRLLDQLRGDGARVAAYGAAAKGNTLLCTCGLDKRHLRYVVDKSPLKQGLFTPGSRLPVVGPEALQREPVDVLLVLAWNLLPEIRQQLARWEHDGGRFVVPLPEPAVLTP